MKNHNKNIWLAFIWSILAYSFVVFTAGTGCANLDKGVAIIPKDDLEYIRSLGEIKLPQLLEQIQIWHDTKTWPTAEELGYIKGQFDAAREQWIRMLANPLAKEGSVWNNLKEYLGNVLLGIVLP